MYMVLILLSTTTHTVYQLAWIRGSLRAAHIMHQRLAHHILAATLRFFDKTPAGRMIQRFTKDIGSLDMTLSRRTANVISTTISVASRLVTIIYFAPVFVFPAIALVTCGATAGQYYIRAQLPVKRRVHFSAHLRRLKLSKRL